MDALLRWAVEQPEVHRWGAVAALLAARLGPLTVLVPWIALREAPMGVRGTLVLMLTVALAPLAAQHAHLPEPLSVGTVAAAMVREALVGALFALAAAVPLYALDWAGRLVDTWRGAMLAEVLAPPTGERTSPLGDVLLLAAVTLFVTMGGHRVAFEAFAEGLRILPVGVPLAAVRWYEALDAVGRLLTSALQMAAAFAAPVAAALIASEAALGLLARTAPQIPVFFVGMPLRAAVGLLVLLLSIGYLLDALPQDFTHALSQARRLVRGLGGG